MAVVCVRACPKGWRWCARALMVGSQGVVVGCARACVVVGSQGVAVVCARVSQGVAVVCARAWWGPKGWWWCAHTLLSP